MSDLPLSRVRKSYKKALAASTVYKFDAERAKKLMAEAGWKPGADGVLTNAKGERMEFEFRVHRGAARSRTGASDHRRLLEEGRCSDQHQEYAEPAAQQRR